MAFTSASFIVLTIASVLLYYIVPKKAQWCILLLASAAFYMAGSVKAFAWVVLVSGMTWVTGLILGRYNAIKPADKAQKAQIQHKKKQIAIICAVCCFGLLYAMKYWNFTPRAAAVRARQSHSPMGFCRAARSVVFHFPVHELRY